jgi:hypothetical protein
MQGILNALSGPDGFWVKEDANMGVVLAAVSVRENLALTMENLDKLAEAVEHLNSSRRRNVPYFLCIED